MLPAERDHEGAPTSLGLSNCRQHCIVRADGPERALCARSGRSSATAVALERRPCVRECQWPTADTALRIGLCTARRWLAAPLGSSRAVAFTRQARLFPPFAARVREPCGARSSVCQARPAPPVMTGCHFIRLSTR